MKKTLDSVREPKAAGGEMTYLFSKALEAFLNLSVARMRRGFGAVLFLEGTPGGGKTAFAKALAKHLGGKYFYYSGSPDKERDLLYEIDVKGVVTRKNAWIQGPAWQAFEASRRGEFAVLLIDEVDKTSPGFDAFLLRLLEEWTFRSPNGDEITADPTKIAVVLTSNGRRRLRPEVLRRCQRITVPLPEDGRLQQIIQLIAGKDVQIPSGLLDVMIRIGAKVREEDAENAPSPKEMALCCIDLLQLKEGGVLDDVVWREVAASYLTKGGGPAHLDRVCKYAWARALRTEVER